MFPGCHSICFNYGVHDVCILQPELTAQVCVCVCVYACVCVYRLLPFVGVCCLLKRCRTGGIRARKKTLTQASRDKQHTHTHTHFLSYFTHTHKTLFPSPFLKLSLAPLSLSQTHTHTYTHKQSLALPRLSACVFFIIHLNIYKSDLRPY